MGGLGSGRHWGTRKFHTTDDIRALDIRALKRLGVLKKGRHKVRWTNNGKVTAEIEVIAEMHQVILKYRYMRGEDSRWIDVDLPIRFSYSKCNFGGLRTWFICPSTECQRRVAVLYASEKFVCRNCLRLKYGSQYEDVEMRAVRKAMKIREKLKWQDGVLDGKGNRPKGMHLKSY